MHRRGFFGRLFGLAGAAAVPVEPAKTAEPAPFVPPPEFIMMTYTASPDHGPGSTWKIDVTKSGPGIKQE